MDKVESNLAVADTAPDLSRAPSVESDVHTSHFKWVTFVPAAAVG